MGAGAAIAAGVGMVATAGATMYSANQAKKAAEAAGKQTYERINLDDLQARAQKVARENAINSLGLEAELTPEVAAARKELSGQISNELAMKGNIDPDVANQVSRRAITGGNTTGIQGLGGPVTAATLGLTAMDLNTQRQQKAAALLAANPLPESGLSPDALASASVADLNGLNQFNANKANAVAQANANRTAIIAGGIQSIGSSIGSGIGAMYGAGSPVRNQNGFGTTINNPSISTVGNVSTIS